MYCRIFGSIVFIILERKNVYYSVVNGLDFYDVVEVDVVIYVVDKFFGKFKWVNIGIKKGDRNVNIFVIN